MEAMWNFFDPRSKATVLGVLRREIDETLALAADPTRWEASTACENWQVRDVIAHLVDTTEGYLPAFDIARSGGTAHEPLGLRAMAKRVDEGAKAATADVSGVERPFAVGIRTSGVNGGDTRVDISSDGVQFAPGDHLADVNGGTVRGDRQLASDFRALMFPI